MQRIELQVERGNVRAMHRVDGETQDPGAGQVLLRVDRFGLSANNVTYAARGEDLGYWRFFPASGDADRRGIIPVWGFAEVIASRHDEVPAGQRYFGYLPMASHVLMTPTAVTATAFVDGVPHRQPLPAFYNRYNAHASDAANPQREAEHAVLRPLLGSAWLLADFLADQGFFGADAVLLSSASSKTAMGCAMLLAASGQRPVFGLTSPARLDFVAGLGCYQQAIMYDRIASLPADTTFAFVDLAGDAGVRRAVHTQLRDRLRASILFGSTHDRGEPRDAMTLPGPQPVPFFGPGHMQKRMGELGTAGFQQAMADAQGTIMASMSRWLRIVEDRGPDAIQRVYRELLDGGRPYEGHVLSFG